MMSIEGSSNLHSLKIGEILDQAFRLYRKNFLLFIGITGILLVPLLVLELLSQYFFSDTTIVSFLDSILTTYLLTGAVIWAASRTYFGHSVLINDAYGQARRFIGPFFAANLLQGLAFIPVGILVVIVMLIFGVSVGTNQIFIIAIVVSLPIVLVLSTRWGVVLPAIMFEDLRGGDGLRRSWFLTKNEFWHTCIPIASSSLLSYLIVALPTLLITYLFQWLSLPEWVMAGTMISLVLAQLGQIIALPLTLSIEVILYYDLRVRREGFDLELALQTTEEDAAPEEGAE